MKTAASSCTGSRRCCQQPLPPPRPPGCCDAAMACRSVRGCTVFDCAPCRRTGHGDLRRRAGGRDRGGTGFAGLSSHRNPLGLLPLSRSLPGPSAANRRGTDAGRPGWLGRPTAPPRSTPPPPPPFRSLQPSHLPPSITQVTATLPALLGAQRGCAAQLGPEADPRGGTGDRQRHLTAAPPPP